MIEAHHRIEAIVRMPPATVYMTYPRPKNDDNMAIHNMIILCNNKIEEQNGTNIRWRMASI